MLAAKAWNLIIIPPSIAAVKLQAQAVGQRLAALREHVITLLPSLHFELEELPESFCQMSAGTLIVRSS